MEIRAWKGVRFDPEKVENPGAAISPPYDVIDDRLREKLHERSPYNIVRIIQGRRAPADNPGDNVYTRAATVFAGWLDKGVLAEDPEDRLYVYRQDFHHEGRGTTRLGLICLTRIEDFGKGIMAHERTLAGPKKDRLELTRATGAQFGNIFVLYDEEEQSIDRLLAEAAEGEPLLSWTDDDEVTHRLYAISDPKKIESVQAALRGRPAMIADGHHRYETAHKFSQENPDVEAAQYVMLTAVNMRNEGLLILPTHRLVKEVEGYSTEDLLAKLGEAFDVRSVPAQKAGVPAEVRQALNDCFERHVPCFALYAGDGSYHIATLREGAAGEGIEGGGAHSDAWRSMDVTILHKTILEGMLGISEEALRDQTNVEYIKDIGDAVDQARQAVDSGRCQVLFLQNPPRMQEMQAVCEAGERMPQKSTFFHPKIWSGLVIHKIL